MNNRLRSNWILLGVLALTFKQCIPYRDFKHFTLYKEAHKSSNINLKLAGIYYTVKPAIKYTPDLPDGYLKLFVLYQDGTYFNSLVFPNHFGQDSTLQYALKTFSERPADPNDISKWGVYRLTGDRISIQFFGERRPWQYWVIHKEGSITSDSTIQFSGQYEPDTPKNATITYRFYRTENKPDSTNLFMTNEKVKRRILRKTRKRTQ